ncbi:MAG: DUF3303 family protein [Rhodospirillales bacterium]|nr:DUF3303 family protein [Rhodospirillales bacterium]MBO6785584.1 DUF3303 family protein [Rhodospirillales bacterium]
MLYMVIETFIADADVVYARFNEKGRMLPDGLAYVNSWVSEDRTVCYQIMETPDRALLDEWITRWNDIVSFEVVPVHQSADAQKLILGMEQVSTPPGT